MQQTTLDDTERLLLTTNGSSAILHMLWCSMIEQGIEPQSQEQKAVIPPSPTKKKPAVLVESFFYDPKAIATLPTQRLRDFVTTVADNMTVFQVDQFKYFTLREKAALVSHPVFADILRIFALDTLVGYVKPKPAQLTALKFLERDIERRQEKEMQTKNTGIHKKLAAEPKIIEIESEVDS